jgi:hypothetical protein
MKSKKDSSNRKNENQAKNTFKNQVNEKDFSTKKDVIQPKHMNVLMQIKSLQGVEITQTSFHSLEDWGDLYDMKHTHP